MRIAFDLYTEQSVSLLFTLFTFISLIVTFHFVLHTRYSIKIIDLLLLYNFLFISLLPFSILKSNH